MYEVEVAGAAAAPCNRRALARPVSGIWSAIIWRRQRPQPYALTSLERRDLAEAFTQSHLLLLLIV